MRGRLAELEGLADNAAVSSPLDGTGAVPLPLIWDYTAVVPPLRHGAAEQFLNVLPLPARAGRSDRLFGLVAPYRSDRASARSRRPRRFRNILSPPDIRSAVASPGAGPVAVGEDVACSAQEKLRGWESNSERLQIRGAAKELCEPRFFMCRSSRTNISYASSCILSGSFGRSRAGKPPRAARPSRRGAPARAGRWR